MAVNQGDLKNKLQTKAEGKKDIAAIDYLTSNSMKDQFKMALPKHLETDKFIRTAVTELRLNKALQQCSVPSLLGAFMQAALLGLEPGSLLGQCYLVPFNNSKTGQKECQFIIGYRGMISLARRSGNIQSINAYAVYDKDEFEYSYGLSPDIKHKPALKDRGEFLGVYGVAKFKDGGVQFEFMSKEEVDRHKKRSKTSSNGPWVTDYEEMAKKTVIRKMFKYLPIAIEELKQALSDESVVTKKDTSPSSDVSEMLDIDYSFQTIDAEAEVVEEQKEGQLSDEELDKALGGEGA